MTVQLGCQLAASYMMLNATCQRQLNFSFFVDKQELIQSKFACVYFLKFGCGPGEARTLRHPLLRLCKLTSSLVTESRLMQNDFTVLCGKSFMYLHSTPIQNTSSSRVMSENYVARRVIIKNLIFYNAVFVQLYYFNIMHRLKSVFTRA